MVSALSSPDQLWLYRCKPQDDELFSSWLVRLSWGLAVKLQYMCVRVLGRRPGYLAGDIDRCPEPEIIDLLSRGTGVSADRVWHTGLAAYSGALWPDYSAKGFLPWVIPIYRNGRRRQKHGIQYCAICMQGDEKPYFRRAWRLAFNVACPKHGIVLRDACPACGEHIEYHSGDFGVRLLPTQCPISTCRNCGHDLRELEDRPSPVPSERLLRLQRQMYSALSRGYSGELPGGDLYAFTFFQGAHYVISTLVSKGHGARLRRHLMKSMPTLAELPEIRPEAFERLRVADRLTVMELCAAVLENWPYQFIDACKESRVASSYIIRYLAYMPYWVYREIRWDLNDQDYAVSAEERDAAARYLEAHGMPANDFSINILLGRCRPHSEAGARLRRIRWNPRGGHK